MCDCKSRLGVKKKTFGSRNAAFTFALRTGRGGSRMYKCPSGKGYHITKGK